MKKLPLYDPPALAAVERTKPLVVDPSCQRCALGTRAGLRNRCVGPAVLDSGKPGPTLLVVGEAVGAEEDRQNTPFVSEAGQLLRRSLMRLWPTGRIVLDNATRCFPVRETKDKLLPKAVEACRGFLCQTIDEAEPERVLLLGSWAAASVLGRNVTPMSVRGGYGWLWNRERPVPCYFSIHPVTALRNQIIRRWFEADLAEALSRPAPSPPPWRAIARVIESPEDAVLAATELSSASWVALDCETFGRFHSPGFRLLSVAVCAKGADSPWVWPMEVLADERCVAALQAVLDATEVVGQNWKYDSQALRAGLGIDAPPAIIDTRLLRRIADPDAAADLETQAELVGIGGHKDENTEHVREAKAALAAWAKYGETVDELMDKAWGRRAYERETEDRRQQRDSGEAVPRRRNSLAPPRERWYSARQDWWTDDVREAINDGIRIDAYAYALVPTKVLLRYNALDTLTTARLGELGERWLKDERIARVWGEAVSPAAWALERVEQRGVHVNRDSVLAFSAYIKLRAEDVRKRLSEYGETSPRCWADSPKQVAELLFGKLKLPVITTTDSGAPSTDKKALEALKHKSGHPVVGDLLDWRQLAKLQGTYADGLLPHVQADGCVHTSYNVDGARTGRISSQGPNMQNAPRAGTPEGKMFRDCFAALPGNILVEGDLSQAELRAAAMLSGDEEMRKVFLSGEDFHMTTARYVAPMVWKVAPEAVTKEHRSKTKTLVFGILYGMTDNGLAARTGCTKDEAASIRNAVMGRFKRLDRWIRESIRDAHKAGGSYTWWNGHEKFRWRALPALADQDDWSRSNAENASFNGPVQGLANEICLASLVALERWLDREEFPAHIVVTVHDSILCECRAGRELELAAQMNKIMTSWPSLGVPMAADFSRGPAWGSMKSFALPSPRVSGTTSNAMEVQP